MASFLGVLKGIGKVALGIATNPVTPMAVSVVAPGFGAIVSRISSAIVNIEAAHVQANKEEGNGAERLSFVKTDFQQSLDIMDAFYEERGQDLVYDDLALENAINMQVAAFNAFKKLKDSIKVVDRPKAA